MVVAARIPAVEQRVVRKIERASLLEGIHSPFVVLFVVILFASIGESIHHGTFALFTEAKLSFTARDIGWLTAAGVGSVLVQDCWWAE